MATINFHKEQFLTYSKMFILKNNSEDSSLSYTDNTDNINETNNSNNIDNSNDTKCLQLKITHTFNVLENTNSILETLDTLTEHDKHIARLTSLYHDIGRFEQFKQYQTFSDAKSVNHAQLGIKVIKNKQFLAKEDKTTIYQVLYAVLMHNRRDLPTKMNKNYLMQCQIIRDADKLDILRIFGEHINNSLPEKESILLNVQDEPTKWTNSIIKAIQKNQTVKYTDLRYANDFKLLLGAWVYNLSFPISRLIVKEKKLLNPILSSLPENKEIQDIVQKIYKYLND